MNIFVLDEDPKLAALYHNDRHVRKMMIEYAQLMSTAHRRLGTTGKLLYKITHVNHPSSIWTRESKANYHWLYSLWKELASQYEARFGKVHYSWKLLNESLLDPPDNQEDLGLTSFKLAMPVKYRDPDAVKSYRKYYIKEKAHLAFWTNPSSIPPWWSTR